MHVRLHFVCLIIREYSRIFRCVSERDFQSWFSNYSYVYIYSNIGAHLWSTSVWQCYDICARRYGNTSARRRYKRWSSGYESHFQQILSFHSRFRCKKFSLNNILFNWYWGLKKRVLRLCIRLSILSLRQIERVEYKVEHSLLERFSPFFHHI